MREFSHGDLHEKIERDALLKKRAAELRETFFHSDKDWTTTQEKIMELYADAVGCDNSHTAKELAGKITDYFLFTKVDEMKIADIEKMAKGFLEDKKCCSPHGNDYTCFCVCDEK